MTTAPLSPERLAEIEASHRSQANVIAVDHPVDLQERSDHRAIGELLTEVHRLQSAVDHLASAERDSAETQLVLEQQDRDLERMRAEVVRAQVVAVDHIAASRVNVPDLLDENEQQRIRIAALESGLREACNELDDAGGCGGTVSKLRALADGVQSSKETT